MRGSYLDYVTETQPRKETFKEKIKIILQKERSEEVSLFLPNLGRMP